MIVVIHTIVMVPLQNQARSLSLSQCACLSLVRVRGIDVIPSTECVE
jgi:hypothetical protein